jgi:hypothetical protein
MPARDGMNADAAARSGSVLRPRRWNFQQQGFAEQHAFGIAPTVIG